MVAQAGQSGLIMELRIETAAAMEALGSRLAGLCPIGSKLFLQGDLGAGKTTLVRGFLRTLGHSGAVKSPTYTLVEPYSVQGHTLYHFDLYRLQYPLELEAIGVRDYFDKSAYWLVEWPEHGGRLLGEPDIHIQFRHGASVRDLTLTAKSHNGDTVLAELHNQ
jgi:tRNA threonylcarbamoyladenosine biosynthesis protein TsaE